MIPLIISSPNADQTKAYLSEKNLLFNLHYHLTPTGNSLGIVDIKNLINQTIFAASPNSINTFLIEDGQKMTLAAQNALLKTFEEAKPEQQFIITTNNHHLLLPTIISRCCLIVLQESQKSGAKSLLNKIITSLSQPPALLPALTDEILTTGPEPILLDVIQKLRQANQKLPTLKRTKIISLATICLSDIKLNVNPKLAVDNFLLKSHAIVTMNPADA